MKTTLQKGLFIENDSNWENFSPTFRVRFLPEWFEVTATDLGGEIIWDKEIAGTMDTYMDT